MAGIIHKIEEKLKGGKKEGEKHDEYKQGEGHAQCVKPGHGHGEHKPEHKEGMVDKIKGKIRGEGGKDKKKKKEKKKKEDGHDSSSSSDSD